MEIGMPTLLELDGAAENAKLCAELGLRFVELNMNLPEYADITGIDPARLRALGREWGISFTLHLDERMDVCDFNPLVRGAYRETLRRALELAGEAGIPVLNLHLSNGVYFTLPGQRVYLYAQREGHFLAAMDELCTLIDAHGPDGAIVCIENTDGFAPFARRGLEHLLRSPRVGLTLDVGHMHTAHDCDADFYAAHMDKLRHMHLHDARRADGKNHLPLGEGELDWRAKLELAASRGARAVLEIKTVQALRASVAALRADGRID